LCSIEVVTTWSPGRRSPLIAWFSAAVAFSVKMNRELSRASKRTARRSRASKRSRAERIERMWPERPGLPARRIAEATASAVPGGLGSDVAALSR